MYLFRQARHPVRAVRFALALLLLTLGLNALAHASHQHKDLNNPSHTAACGYCVTFGAAADSAPDAAVRLPTTIAVFTVAIAVHAPVRRTFTSAVPRGPPQI
jgi:hypothetical protein